MAENTWGQKLKRTLTAFLPISVMRKGSCTRCGECCKLPNVCPFLGFDNEGLAICKIYPIRPMNCRKYPRTQNEQVCKTCGYNFAEEKEMEEVLTT